MTYDKTYELQGKVICSQQSLGFLEVKLGAGYGYRWSKSITHAMCIKNLVDGKLVVKAELYLVKRGDFKVSAGKVGGTDRNENLSSELIENIFTKKIFSDFKLVSNGLEYDCHKNFIASQSETLQNAVERWAPDGKMIMNEFKPEVIEVLLNFFYRRPLDAKVFFENVVEFLDIGEQYDLPSLKAKAETTMMTNLNKLTFTEFLNLWTENTTEWKRKLGLSGNRSCC